MLNRCADQLPGAAGHYQDRGRTNTSRLRGPRFPERRAGDEPSAYSPRTRSSPSPCSSHRRRRTRRAAAAAAAAAEAEAEADPRRGTSACRSSAGGVTRTRRVTPAGTTPSRISGPGSGLSARGRRRRSSTRRRSATWKAVPRSRAGRRGIMLLGATRSRRSHRTRSATPAR